MKKMSSENSPKGPKIAQITSSGIGYFKPGFVDQNINEDDDDDAKGCK